MVHHSPDSSSVAERRRSFRRMHEHGCFVIPNPWDSGLHAAIGGADLNARF